MKSLFKEELTPLGQKAYQIKKGLWGDKVFYIKNIHINYTNICLNKCKFCAFARDDFDADAYEFSLQEIVDYIRSIDIDLREVHIVGGLHPKLKFDYYCMMLKTIKENFPNISIKAFSAVEIDYFTQLTGFTTEKVLKRLRDHGLDMLPGGGAEIFAEDKRKIICPEKISSQRWLEIMEIAHNIGIKTNATMLYGHIESEDDIIDHLTRIKKLQHKTNGFNAFIPLSFHPENTFLSNIKKSTGVEDLKITAISRILLDNIPHIKSYWVMLGERTSQIALYFGADDLDGTIVKERITHSAGATSKEGLTEQDLIDMIKSAGFTPVERDSFYNEIRYI
ncbi:MAG: aminofutalosine synthase MqnE [Calditerrivibrio sp.]|nr:aminofutalosine synthase MqnE [Calditerrivibrio sp.]